MGKVPIKKKKIIDKKKIGDKGELLAKRYLRRNGYRIVETNCLCFVEVKYRRNDTMNSIEFAVDYKKQKHLARSADFYRMEKGYVKSACRFDVLLIRDQPMRFGIRHEFTLYQNAFQVDTF